MNFYLGRTAVAQIDQGHAQSSRLALSEGDGPRLQSTPGESE